MISLAYEPEIDPDKPYRLTTDDSWWCERYKMWMFLKEGFRSDGATWAYDIPKARPWLHHDKICETGELAPGTPATVWMASRVISDLLHESGHHIRERVWLFFTLLGAKNCRKNGIFWLKRK